MAEIVKGLMDLIFPLPCAFCGNPLVEDDTDEICPACLRNICFISSPICAKCGLPFVTGRGRAISVGNAFGGSGIWALAVPWVSMRDQFPIPSTL